MSFYAVYDRITPGNNKYMATLMNTSSTRKVVVNRIYAYNWQVAAAAGALQNQELRGITARTAGTTVTPVSEDSNDSLSANITADHASTSVTEGLFGLRRRFYCSSEEGIITTGTNTITGARAFLHDGQLVYWRMPGQSGIVLRQNQGITIKNVTNDNNGTVSYMIEFDDLPA